MSAALKHDYIRASPKWRNLGARYDAAIINGPDGHEFVQIYAFLKLTVHSHTFSIALVRHYQQMGRHPSSGYIQLKDIEDFDYIFTDTIIRAVQILPKSTYNNFYTVQDLDSPDSYLRLQSTQ
jgi:hypothetical protein